MKGLKQSDCIFRPHRSRIELVRNFYLCNNLPQLVVAKKELEEKWGKLPEGELCRYLKSDLIILRHLNDSIGIDDNPIGSYGNIKEFLDFVIDLDLNKSVW
jgi:hypothetical protein